MQSRNYTYGAGNRYGGFTLIETTLAVIIVGVGVLASMALFEATTKQNTEAGGETTALMLASNIREAMVGVAFADPGISTTHWGPESGESLATYNDADDFDGLTCNPPIDSLRASIPDLDQYSQVITVMPVDPNLPGGNTNTANPTIADGTYTGAVRVRVKILFRTQVGAVAREVLETSWIKLDD